MKRTKGLTQQQLDHRADALNKNRGTPGTNITNAKVHGNRGKQKNPNRKTGVTASQELKSEAKRS